MKKVIHIITGLNDGGAEGALFRLIRHTKYEIDHSVVSLTGAGRYKALLESEGIKVECLEFGKLNFITRFYRLISIIKTNEADAVQTWLYHADLLGGIACFFTKQKNLFWGIRQADFELKSTKWPLRLVISACAFFSSVLPKAHITCATAAVSSHQKVGYSGDFIVIPNGYDLEKLRPQPSERETLLGSKKGNSELIFGMVARFDPAKDHANMLEAFAAFLSMTNESCKLLLAGKGCTRENTALTNKIRELCIEQHVILFGQTENISSVMSCLDFHVLSSEYEGFPNVIAEAMSCGVPCISTSVGDAHLIIGDTGWLVPAKNYELLAHAMIDASKLRHDLQNWEKLKERCRQRIQDNFSLDAMAFKFNKVWFERS